MHGGTRRFQHSAMTPYEFNGGYYALPYTQSFLVMFYRTDMFEENGWDIPRTWTDVIQLIPELQIMNFQFYLPLNTAGASSVVNQIFASYLYQSVDDIKQAFYRTAINEFGEKTEAMALSLYMMASHRQLLADPNFKSTYLEDYLK